MAPETGYPEIQNGKSAVAEHAKIGGLSCSAENLLAENRRLRRELEASIWSRDRLRVLTRAVEQGPTAVIITNTLGEIEYVNPRFVEITGYTLEDVQGQNPRILKSGTTPSSEYAEMWQRIKNGEEWHGEFHNRKKNGELYWASARISGLKNDSGEVTHFIGVQEDITERKRLESDLIRLATTDFLTGIFNRRHYLECSEREVRRTLRHHRPLSVLVMDVDHFKGVNDTYGHPAGDRALHSVAQTLVSTCRQDDIVGKVGGEEFAVTLPETTLDNAVNLGERLRAEIMKIMIPIEKGNIGLTASIGAATILKGDESIEGALVRADKGLYIAKSRGRNLVYGYED